MTGDMCSLLPYGTGIMHKQYVFDVICLCSD